MPKAARFQSDFTGGMNSDSDPRSITENQAHELNNLIINNEGKLVTDYEVEQELSLGLGVVVSGECMRFRADYDENGDLNDTEYLVVTVTESTTKYVKFFKKGATAYTELTAYPFAPIVVTGSEPYLTYANGILFISDGNLLMDTVPIYHVSRSRFGTEYNEWVKESAFTPKTIISQNQLDVSFNGARTSVTLGILPGEYEEVVRVDDDWYGESHAETKYYDNSMIVYHDTTLVGTDENVFTIDGILVYIHYSTRSYLITVKFDKNAVSGKTIEWIYSAIRSNSEAQVRLLSDENLYPGDTLTEYKAKTLTFSGSEKDTFYGIEINGSAPRTDILYDGTISMANTFIKGQDDTIDLTPTYTDVLGYLAIESDYEEASVFPTDDNIVIGIQSNYKPDSVSMFENATYEFATSAEYHSGNITVPEDAKWRMEIGGGHDIDIQVRMRDEITYFPLDLKSLHIYTRKKGETDWLYLSTIDLDKGIKSHDGEGYNSFKEVTLNLNGYVLASVKDVTMPYSNYYDYHLIPKKSENVTQYKASMYASQRLFAIAPKGYEDRVIVSYPNKPSSLYSNNYLEIVAQDGDSFVHGVHFDDKALLFKENAMYVLNIGSFEPSTFFIENESVGMGVWDKKAVTKTPYGIFFANQTGVYFYAAERPQNIVDTNIKEEWLEASFEPVLMYHRELDLLYCLPDDGASVAYIFDIKRKAWTKTDAVSGFTSMHPVNGIKAHGVMFGSGADIKLIARNHRNTTFKLVTRDWVTSGPHIRKKLKRVYVTALDATIQASGLTYYLDGATIENTQAWAFSTDKGEMYDWKVSMNFYSVQLVLEGSLSGTGNIKDIGIIYREKLPK